MSENYFIELSKIDVTDSIEKKGRFSYLSWPFAVAELKKNHPEATWDVKRFEGLPFMATTCGVFVEVGVTINGIEHTQIHPVLNHQNKPIASPSSFEINTSIQRALVKAIALHGLGLYIYAGEDLPMDSEPQQMNPEPVNQEHVDGAYKAFKEVIDADVEVMDFKRVQAGYGRLTNDEKMAVMSKFGSEKAEGCKKGYKAIIKTLLEMKEEA